MSLEYKVLGQDSVAITGLNSENRFVAVAWFSTTAAYSTNGITWTISTIPGDDSQWKSIAYGDGKFVAVSGIFTETAAYSTNGITWTQSTIPNADWDAVAYGDDKFVAVAYSTTAAYSTDGITWTESTLPTDNFGRSIAYGDDKFVAVARNTVIAIYSTDGITWTQTTLPESTSWSSVAYGGGKFVALGSVDLDGTSIGATTYSTDGITWTASTITGQAWRSATYGDGKFVAIAYNSTAAAYSTDGITWTESTLPADVGWNSVTYGGGKFVAVSDSYPVSTTAAYSTDGITWIESTLPSSERWTAVGAGTFLVLQFLENNQYTVPSTKQAIISSIYIANNTASSQTYSVAVVPDGETLSSIHYIRKDVTIDGNDFHNIPTKITLSAGDQIITEGSSTDVSINVFGVEK